MNNWIALFRNLDQWSMFKDRYALQLYIYLLVNACHHEYEDEGVYVAKGFVKISGRDMAKQLGMPRGIMRGRMKKLQQGRFISIDSKERRQYMLVAIRNFDDFMHIPATQQGGWFKLSLDVVNKEWFSNAKVLQVYTYIQMLVNRPVDRGLMANQAYISINGISRKTSLTSKEVRTCLKTLINYGEILTSYDEHSRKTIVSSLSEVFPVSLLEDCRSKVKPITNPAIAQVKPNGCTEVVAEEVQNWAQSESGTNTYNTDSYEVKAQNINPATTQVKPNYNQVDGQTSRAQFVETGQSHILRDRDRDGDNSSLLSIKRAYTRTREGEISDEYKEAQECEELIDDVAWQDAIMGSVGLDDRKQLLEYITAFGQQNFCNGKTHKDGCDLKSHFHHWLLKKLEEQKKESGKKNNKSVVKAKRYFSLLESYRVQAEKEKAKILERGVKESDPQHSSIKAMDNKGERFRVAFILCSELADYCIFSNVRTPLNDKQLGETARLIRDNYGYLTFAQFHQFIDKLKMGRYGNTYNKIEPGYILSGLDTFVKNERVVV